VREAFRPSRRDLLTWGAVLGLLTVVQYGLPVVGVDAGTVELARYAAWLVAFAVWMGWFVATGVRVWRAWGE